MLLEKIDEEEIFFAECFYNPICNIESLFDNFDNLGSFSPDKFGKIRQYQAPMLSFESMIDIDTPDLDEKEKMNLRKGTGDIYNLGGRNFGKCESINNYCSLANGKRKRFGDLIGKKEIVFSLNQKTLKLETSEAFFRDNGIRNCYKVTTKDGKEITVTKNHPLLTKNGWKTVLELKENDWLATPRKYNIKNTQTVDENEKYNKIVESDIYWDKFKKIEYVGKKQTVMVSVPGNQNYISNDIVSHNSLIGEKLDIPQSLMTDDGWWCGFASIDMNHITGILDCVRDAVDNHPIVSLFRRRVKTHPNYLITTKNGWKLEGVNLNLNAKSPGDQFIGKHFQKIYFEEASYETEEVYNKRQDAISEKGCVFRISGMTDFTRHSPIGRQFYDPENKNKIINLPQFVNSFFNEKEKQRRIEQYGGEDNLNYKIYVLGQIIEGGESEFDMTRVRDCYLEKRTIKRFEIPKKRFKNFKDFIVVERPKSADRIIIASDIGDGAGGSDLIILSQIGNKYRWLYDIILYNLTASEQIEIFKFLIEKLSANVVGIECGEGIGRTIYRELERIYSKDNLVYYDGREKVNVDFEKDDKGNIKREKGKPVYLQEFMSEWSVRRLKALLYENLLSLPKDFKFDKQLSSVVALPGHSRTKYRCITQQGDHLWSAFKTFAICEWLKNSLLKTPSMNKNENFSGGVSSW